MADRPLDTGRSGGVLFGNGGIQPLGDGIDDVLILDRHEDRIAQILIALDVRGNADLMNDLGHPHFQAAVVCHRIPHLRHGGALLLAAQGKDAVRHMRRVKRTQNEIVRASENGLALHVGIVKSGHHHELRDARERACIDALDDPDGIQSREEEIHQNDIGMQRTDRIHRFLAVLLYRFDTKAAILHGSRTRCAKMFAVVHQ